jgi:hypothetical protein
VADNSGRPVQYINNSYQSKEEPARRIADKDRIKEGLVCVLKTTTDKIEQRRRSAAITRKVRILRMHNLIKKVPKTHRYVLTSQGFKIITALLAARCADAEKLIAAA